MPAHVARSLAIVSGVGIHVLIALPLARMDQLLAQSINEPAGRLELLICRLPQESPDDEPGAFEHVAIVVDAIQEAEEVLVRSLGRHVARWPGIAGAAELRDGSVALVLDLPVLLDSLQDHVQGTDSV